MPLLWRPWKKSLYPSRWSRKKRPKNLRPWLLNLWLLNLVVDDPAKLEEVERSLGWTDDPWLAKLVAIAIVPAICEELLLRGAIARGLRPALGIAGPCSSPRCCSPRCTCPRSG